MPVEIRELIIKATIVDNDNSFSDNSGNESFDFQKAIQHLKDEIIEEITFEILDKIEKQRIR